jgi:hypothetical protein
MAHEDLARQQAPWSVGYLLHGIGGNSITAPDPGVADAEFSHPSVATAPIGIPIKYLVKKFPLLVGVPVTCRSQATQQTRKFG